MSAREDASDRFAGLTTWPSAEPLSLPLLQALIAAHAPVIHFHPEECYFPARAEWYLERALLVDGASGAVIAHHPAPADLPPGPASEPDREKYWLTLDQAIAGPPLEPELTAPGDPRRGNLADACAYVRALHDPALGHTDLQFWMFYPYDGPGLLRLRPFAFGARRADKLLSLWPGGMHEADWELAVLRIDHATLQPSAAFLSQHKGGDVHLGKVAMTALERDTSGRILLYASLYGHASYPHPEERKLFYTARGVKVFALEMALIDRIDRGVSWNLGDVGNAQLISTSWNDPAVPEPAWLAYGWRWGRFEPQGGRFTRKFVDELTLLLESRMASLVLTLHLITLGLFAVALALASRLLGGARGTGLLGELADNSGPLGPRWQTHKWSGDYGFTGPPPAQPWRDPGAPLAHRLSGLFNTVCRPPVMLLSALLRAICAPFLPKA